MNNEYVIINKTEWLKVMEELETKRLKNPYSAYYTQPLDVEINTLKQVLSKGVPLIPVVERAFDAGGAYTLGSHKEFTQTHPNKQDYITNLKFDI